MASTSYKQTKNYVHNELGFNKTEIEKLITDYIDKKLDKKIVDIMDSKWMQRKMLDKIGQVINGYKYKDDPVADFIKNVIKEEVKKAVTDRIKFTEIIVK